MDSNVTTINLGGVNCYLAKCANGYVLIDTGFAAKRGLLLDGLKKAGCKPGNLSLVLMTHGDSDHAGNGAFLQKEYGAPIGMHPDDMGMAESGDMNWNRKGRADRMSLLMKLVGAIVRRAAKQQTFETFKPDVAATEGFDLSRYGFSAVVVHIPGHSKGSIGVLTKTGVLYCGDFLYTIPGLDFVDDLEARKESLQKLKKLDIKMVFPGHGKPVSFVR